MPASAKMAFSIQFLGCAVVEVMDRVQFPASNQPSIQVHVFRSVGWGTFGFEEAQYRPTCYGFFIA